MNEAKAQSRKLMIALSPRILRNKTELIGFPGRTLQYLEQSVAHWVMSLGAMVVMVPTVERESQIRRAQLDLPDYATALDGLILQGGADLDPRGYGEEPHPHARRRRPRARPLRARSVARIQRRRQARVRHLPRHAADQRGVRRHAVPGPVPGRRHHAPARHRGRVGPSPHGLRFGANSWFGGLFGGAPRAA
jgi:hypothetical protein